jgi:hypothetical protein
MENRGDIVPLSDFYISIFLSFCNPAPLFGFWPDSVGKPGLIKIFAMTKMIDIKSKKTKSLKGGSYGIKGTS